MLMRGKIRECSDCTQRRKEGPEGEELRTAWTSGPASQTTVGKGTEKDKHRMKF